MSKFSIIMANFSNDAEVFLSDHFAIKARAVFHIPVYYYLTNEELHYYFTILRDASDDDEARLTRVLTCSTNVSCSCYFCRGEEDATSDEDSVILEVSTSAESRGADADDERDSEESDKESDGEDAATSTPNSSILLSDEASSQTLSPLVDTSVWLSDLSGVSDSDPSVIYLGEDLPPAPIVISSDDSTSLSPSQPRASAARSPSLDSLDSVWEHTFKPDGASSDSIEWSTPVTKKRARRGLTYLEGIHKRAKHIVFAPKDISPIKREADANSSWNSDHGRLGL